LNGVSRDKSGRGRVFGAGSQELEEALARLLGNSEKQIDEFALGTLARIESEGSQAAEAQRRQYLIRAQRQRVLTVPLDLDRGESLGQDLGERGEMNPTIGESVAQNSRASASNAGVRQSAPTAARQARQYFFKLLGIRTRQQHRLHLAQAELNRGAGPRRAAPGAGSFFSAPVAPDAPPASCNLPKLSSSWLRSREWS